MDHDINGIPKNIAQGEFGQAMAEAKIEDLKDVISTLKRNIAMEAKDIV